MTKYADFDALISESRIAKIGGQEWDLSRCPFEVFVTLMEKIKGAEGPAQTSRVYRESLQTWLKTIDPSIPENWVDTHVDARMMIHITKAVFDGLYADPLVTFRNPEEDLKPLPISEKRSRTSS